MKLFLARRRKPDLMRLVKKPTVKDCAGCRNDFYNGKNDLGVSRCWMLDSAKMVSALDIPIDLRPPYLGIKPKKRPGCYRAPGYIRTKLDAIDSKGFWK